MFVNLFTNKFNIFECLFLNLNLELLEKDDKKEDIYIKILNEFKEDSIISLKYIINRVKLSNLNED